MKVKICISFVWVVALCQIVLTGCNSKPSYVLDKSDMIGLLVDMHKGEIVIDYERSRYNTDSLKQLMAQSIYMKHGVDAAVVDSSLAWYGRHTEDYIEIYDEVIANLQSELDRTHSQVQVFAEGDSINVWPGSSFYKLDNSIPAGLLSFAITPDENYSVGDNFMLQLKVENSKQSPPAVHGTVYAEFGDSLLEIKTGTTGSDGWLKIRMVPDSSLMFTRIYGTISYDLQDDEVIYLDSLSLVRTRFGEDHYYQHNSNRKIRRSK